MVLWNPGKEMENKRKQDVAVGRNVLGLCQL